MITRTAIAITTLAAATFTGAGCGGDDADTIALTETRQRNAELGLDGDALDDATDALEDIINDLWEKADDPCGSPASTMQLFELTLDMAKIAEENREIVLTDIRNHIDDHC